MVPQVRARTALTFLCLSDRANLGLCCALLPKGLVSPVMSRNLVRQRQSEQRILLRPKFVHPRFVPLHVRYSRRNVGANLGHQRVWVAQEKPGPPAEDDPRDINANNLGASFGDKLENNAGKDPLRPSSMITKAPPKVN